MWRRVSGKHIAKLRSNVQQKRPSQSALKTYSAFGKSLCTYKRCCKWCPRASIQAWTRLILFENIFCRSAFGKSLCNYKRCWKWCPRASIRAWIRLILFANTFCRSAFGKSLCTYKRCWKWCPLASIQAWTRKILFANTFWKYAFGKVDVHLLKDVMSTATSILTTKSTYRSLNTQRLSEHNVHCITCGAPFTMHKPTIPLYLRLRTGYKMYPSVEFSWTILAGTE
jgi:hypothetical protein